MKVALIQQASGEYTALLRKIFPWHLKYCSRHEIIYLPSFGRITKDRHPNFDRFPLLIETMRAGYADIVIWMDADCVIADGSISLAEAADEFLYLGAVKHPAPWKGNNFHFNMGVMYLRTCKRSLELLEACHASGNIPAETDWQDQSTLFVHAENLNFPICRISNRWNSTPAANDCHKPVVRSYHGIGLASSNELVAIAESNLSAT